MVLAILSRIDSGKDGLLSSYSVGLAPVTPNQGSRNRSEKYLMHTNANFYMLQNACSRVYIQAQSEADALRAKTVHKYLGRAQATILELGAGGCQTAIALAELGHRFAANDLVESFLEHGHQQALTMGLLDQINFICSDFQALAFKDKTFDAICYFDGFGIGSDQQQQALLRNLAKWLKTAGRALIEIYTPWYWQKVAGTTVSFDGGTREYSFDFDSSRMIDSRCSIDGEVAYQSLRCYSPEELHLLLRPTGMELTDIVSGGFYDYQARTYHPTASLETAMSYLAILSSINR
jgi:SAM-dependent methyltransferase